VPSALTIRAERQERAALEAEGVLSADEQKAVANEVQKLVDAASERAAKSPLATFEEMRRYVYAD